MASKTRRLAPSAVLCAVWYGLASWQWYERECHYAPATNRSVR